MTEHMRIAMVAALVVSLEGCISQSVIRDRAIEENVTIEDITDTILVTNILRARDQAPLQFADIPLIHESFQLTSGLTPTIVFGPVHPGSVSDSLAPTISVQEAPTFDLNNLDTQEFIRGIMSPVKPRVVEYWLDRGLNDRIALLLFFSSVTITVKDQAPLTISNDPRRALDSKASTDGFLAYLSLINSITGQFRIIEAPNLTPVGPPFSAEMDKHLRELSKVDGDKYELDPLEKNPDPDPAKRAEQPYTLVEEPVEGKSYPSYQLFSVSDKKILICFNTARASVRSPADQKLCKQRGGAAAGSKAPNNPCLQPADFLKKDADCSATLKFSVRSAGDVVHFLGDLVWLQENRDLPAADLYTPFTLRDCPPQSRPACSSGGALFNLARETPEVRGRLRVPYRGQTYTVPDASPDDHTLQVLAITAQLINLNKSAKELTSTPTVQIVP